MTVHIQSDKPCNTSLGYSWPAADDVIAVDDHGHAQELLAIPGFHEVHPSALPGKHEAPDAADDSDDEGGEAASDDAAKPTAKGARGKAVTEDAK